jgi:hypothetical protein
VPETFNKLQPDRTVYLRGFNTFAAAASIHSASPDGFTVSGTFRDPADFAVAVLYDADNYYEHPLIKYLPDFNLAGLTLNFNLLYSDAVQPIDSPKYNWIDWATLDCILEDNSTSQVRLFDHSMLLDSAFPAATTTCTVTTTTAKVQPFDRVTLWYQNLAFDYIVPAGLPTIQFAFFAQGTGTVHSITINGTVYPHTESNPLGESSADQANALIAAINAANVAGTQPYVTAAVGATSNAVLLTVLPAQDGLPFPVSAADGANGTSTGTLRYTSPTFVATQIANQINATNWAAANTTHALMASTSGAAITVTAGRYGSATVSGTSVTIPGLSSGVTVFSGITPGSPIFIAGATYIVASVLSPTCLTLMTAVPSASDGTGIAWVAPRGGHDGNLIELYTLSKTGTLAFDSPTYQLAGGSSSVTWNCTLDFTALGIDSLRQCWLTFAPALITGPYTATEWTAVFSGWELTGPAATQQLLVAGPGSTRIEQDDSACTYTGVWTQESGFYSKYFATATSDPATSVTIGYISQFTHDLWLGTSLYSDRANVSVSVDGDTATPLVTQLTTDSAIVTRRQARTGIAAGRHTVTIRPTTSGVFYFNFLEVVVASAPPNALPARTGISPALDFDTNHTYMLPPARIMWMMDQLGYAGPMNEYLGVFWWNERVQTGATFSTGVIAFGGTFGGGDTVTLTLNGTALNKSVFPEDTPSTIALHFAAMVNQFTGVWASATGPQLTMMGRSADSAYTVSFTVSVAPPVGGTTAGTAVITQAPEPGQDGTWVIDDTISPPLNRAVRDWHTDFYNQCASRSREVVTSCSMELVNPPAGYAAKFPDGTAVLTATGFGTLSSTQCAVGASQVLAYQKAVYRCIAGLQNTAGLTPCIQYGEFLWWYLAESGGGMAYYDSETTAAALAALGRPLYVFTGQNDDPAVNGGADAQFLRNRLRDHVAALVADIGSVFSNTITELLWPYDVNYPSLLGPAPSIGGQLNRYVNLPVEWQSPATTGLTRIKVEALSFGSSLRNLDLASQAIALFPAFGWPLGRLRYLVPVFGSACPWVRELGLARGAGITTNNLWAFDHVCLYNLQVPEGALERRSFVKVA